MVPGVCSFLPPRVQQEASLFQFETTVLSHQILDGGEAAHWETYFINYIKLLTYIKGLKY